MEWRTNAEVMVKDRSEAMGKHHQTMPSTSTQLIDDQNGPYAHSILPKGNVSHRRITEKAIAHAAAHLPAGAKRKDVKSALYNNHTQSGPHKP